MALMNKKSNTTKYFLITYIILSLIFIFQSVFQNLKEDIYQVGLKTGQNATIVDIMEKLDGENCKTIQLFAGSKKITVLNNSCAGLTQ